MFDMLRKLFWRRPSEKLVRHTALSVRDGKLGFVSVDVVEAELRRKVQGMKGDFLVRVKADGDVEAHCSSCHVDLEVAQRDRLHWFRCPGCGGISINPTPNVDRDVQFSIQDGKSFEHQLHYLSALPPGLVPPFSEQEVGDRAWHRSPRPVIPVPDKGVGGKGAASLAEVEKAIAPVVQEARSTYPEAKRRFLAGLPEGASFLTTVRLHDDAGSIEVVFVKVAAIEDGQVEGTITNEVNTVRGYRKGQEHRFRESEIMDWTIDNADGTQEGNIVGRFLAVWQRSSC